MGVTAQEARALLSVYQAGVAFTRTATIGRHWLLASPAELARLFKKMGCSPPGLPDFLSQQHTWADDYFTLLGAREVVSVDVSDYEGATIVHDMGEPIPEAFREQFDLVYDGGTLEHVFDFPRAIKNCLEMVKVGGHFCCSSPGNNLFGHGFYQFSSELFYRVLSSQNGFQVKRLLAMETQGGRRYEVADPAEVGSRIELHATRPCVVLFVLAQRAARVPILARAPCRVIMWPPGRGDRMPRNLRSTACSSGCCAAPPSGCARHCWGPFAAPVART
jgi:SAM-dependent methyltransferase